MGITITIGKHPEEVGECTLPRHLGYGNELRLAHWGRDSLVRAGARFFNVYEGAVIRLTEEQADELEKVAKRYAEQPGIDIMRNDNLAVMRWAITRIRWALANEDNPYVYVE